MIHLGLDAFDASVGDDGQASYSRTHKFETTTPPDDAGILIELSGALAAVGLVQGQPMPGDSGAKCMSVKAKPTRSPRATGTVWVWTADATFSSRLGKSDPSNQKNPTLRPPKIRVYTNKFEVVAARDVDTGLPVQNSAGAPFVRMRKRGRAAFKISKAFATINWPKLGDWESNGLLYTRNLAEWTPGGPYTAVLGAQTAAVGTAWIVDLSAELAFDQGSPYVQVDAEIWYDVLEFRDFVLNQGFWYLDADQRRRRFLVDGQHVNTPQFLAADGTALPVTVPPTPPIELPFQYYQKADWSVLPLP